jgi:hypothetical protein
VHLIFMVPCKVTTILEAFQNANFGLKVSGLSLHFSTEISLLEMCVLHPNWFYPDIIQHMSCRVFRVILAILYS